ncbi:hypothetical protein [Mesorhizobium sp. IMUNJ 23232]|uniref:hypothetical protein n=1 Tax=Mesorhizobium sp. IMUNJ 23232 TaxID=3376064 RepID=UPI00379827A5
MLAHFGILPPTGKPRQAKPENILRIPGHDGYVLATSSGVFEPFHRLGTPVRAGQEAGRIHNLGDPARTGDAPLRGGRDRVWHPRAAFRIDGKARAEL